jgi:hypothetical protein
VYWQWAPMRVGSFSSMVVKVDSGGWDDDAISAEGEE